jgi:hypothetical protein
MDPMTLLIKVQEVLNRNRETLREHLVAAAKILETPANELSTADFLAVADGFDKMAYALRAAAQTIREGVEPDAATLN